MELQFKSSNPSPALCITRNTILHTDLFDAPASAISREIIGLIPGDELIRLSSGTGGSFFRSDLRVLEGTLMSYEATDLSNTRLREITRVDDLRGPREGDWVLHPHNLQIDNGNYYHILSTEAYS